jgi:hypothetical protein
MLRRIAMLLSLYTHLYYRTYFLLCGLPWLPYFGVEIYCCSIAHCWPQPFGPLVRAPLFSWRYHFSAAISIIYWNLIRIVGFEVLSAVVAKISVFWDVTPDSPLKVNRRLGGTYRRAACHLLSRWFLARLIRPWIWRRYCPPKRQLIVNGLPGGIFQKIALFLIRIVGASSRKSPFYFWVSFEVCIFLEPKCPYPSGTSLCWINSLSTEYE